MLRRNLLTRLGVAGVSSSSMLSRRALARRVSPQTAATLSLAALFVQKRMLAAEAVDSAAEARRKINELWLQQSAAQEKKVAGDRGSSVFPEADVSEKIRALMDEYKMTGDTPRDLDVSRALGESFDRLLLMLVPLHQENVPYFARALDLAGRNEIPLSMRTIQHMFARAGSYPEAIAMFNTMRKSRVAMNIEAYYAMVYCLQRIEEESWALQYREEILEKKDGGVSNEAMEFILRGCENQLLPESKPWLGRVMFADADSGEKRETNEEFDKLGSEWVNRFKEGGAHGKLRNKIAQKK